MNKSFSKLFLAPLAVVVLASFAMAPAAAAGARGGGGGGGSSGGGARAGGSSGGGAKQSAQPNNSKADSRSNEVRSTSVNNTNVNVNVDQHGGVGGWDHPVAGAIVVGGAIAVTAAALGSTVAAVPVGCVPVNYGGMVYQQCGATWYAPQGPQFVVVNPPY